jgi:[ribosomal protein S5]-alanine N-acetyltransferase
MLSFNFRFFPEIKTDRFLLRRFTPADAAAISALRSNDIVNEYIERPKQISCAEAEEFIKKTLHSIEQNDLMYWAIVPRREKKLIGTTCLFHVSKEVYRAEIGYELEPRWHGKKVMQEIIPRVIEFGFKKMLLKRIEAFVKPGNIKSVKLLEKNNFKIDKQAELRMTAAEKQAGLVIYSLQNGGA